MGTRGRAGLGVAINVLVGALTNIATGGFDLTRYRWWFVVALVLLDLMWILLEIRWAGRARAGAASTQADAPQLVDSGTAASRDAARSGARRPWMLPQLDDWWVDRPELRRELLSQLTSAPGRTVGVTTALFGAGGFGKTTLAVRMCGMPEIAATFPGGLLWVTLGEAISAPQLASKINDLSMHLGAERPSLSDPEQAGYHLGQLLEDRDPILLVIDDVWEASSLRPLLAGGSRCTRLVTTRKRGVLPEHAVSVRVDEMAPPEAGALLEAGLAPIAAEVKEGLLRLTGRWPLLLALLNGAMRHAVRDGEVLGDVARELAAQLAEGGPTTLDLSGEQDRDRAVRRTIEASLGRLRASDQQRYFELGIFPEDVDIPRVARRALWQATGGLSPAAADRLCADLAELSLVQAYRRDIGSLRLHDVLRSFLRAEAESGRLAEWNAVLLDAVRPASASDSTADGPTQWWLLPAGEHYLWRFVPYHLVEADRRYEAGLLVSDLRWIDRKLHVLGAPAVEADVQIPENATAFALFRAFVRDSHLLTPIEPPESLTDILLSRLETVDELRDDVRAYGKSLPQRCRLTNHWPLPPVDDALIRVITGSGTRLTDVVVAPDEKWLATAGEDGVVRIWEMATGAIRLQVVIGDRPVSALAVSSTGDWLAVGSDSGAVGIWEVASGRQLVSCEGHAGPVHDVAVAPDDRWIVTAGEDRTVRIWSATNGKQSAVLTGHEGPVTAVAVLDAHRLATASRDGLVRVWRTDEPTKPLLLKGHYGAVLDLAVSVADPARVGDRRSEADGWLATAGEDGTVRLWTVVTGATRGVLRGHANAIARLAVLPDGHRLVTGSWDDTARLWDPATLSSTGVLGSHRDSVTGVAAASRTGLLVTASADGWTRVWDLRTADRPEATLARRGRFTDMGVAPDGKWIAALRADGAVQVWDVGSAEIVATHRPNEGSVQALAVMPDGSALVLFTWSAMYFWRIGSATSAAVTTVGSSISPNRAAMAPDGTWLVTGGVYGRPCIWKLDGAPAEHLSNAGALDVTVSPDGTWIATADYEQRTVTLWDAATRSVRHVLTGHGLAVRDIAIAPNSAWLATAGGDGVVRLWDASTGASIRSLVGHSGRVTAVAVAFDGARIVTGGQDGSVRVWDGRDGQPIAAMRVDGAVTSVDWLPDGSKLCATGTGGVYVFNFVE